MTAEGFSNSGSGRRDFPSADARQKELRERIDREVPLEAAFTLFGPELGIDTTPHESGGNRFYKSPKSASGDKTASLHVEEAGRYWFDHSNPDSDNRRKSGYGVVSLAYYLGAGSLYSMTGILERLGTCLGVAYEFNPNVVHDGPASGRTDTKPSSSEHRITDGINDRRNIAYFEDRGIPEALLKRYCSACIETVAYSDGSRKSFESVAWPMLSGGHALRSAGGVKRNTKGFPADITLVSADGQFRRPEEGSFSGSLLVFEGFSDFLSYCIWIRRNEITSGGGVDFAPGCDCVVLNSTSNLSKVFPLLPRYERVRVFNDNDNGGKGMAAELALKRCEQKGVPFTLTDEELEWVRGKILSYPSRMEEKTRRELSELRGGEPLLTREDRSRIEEARRAAVAHFNLGSRTAALDSLALQSFADSLTPGSFPSLCSRHNLTPYRNSILLRRISSSRRDGLTVRSGFSESCGVESMALMVYPDDNDVNDRWRAIWNGGMKEAWGRWKGMKENKSQENDMETNEINPNEFTFESMGAVSRKQKDEFRSRMTPGVWKQIQDELIGARDEHRLPAEEKNPDLWYRRNMDIFISECEKYYGPSPLTAMTRGGYTAMPVYCAARHVPNGFYLVNFDLRDPAQPNWYTYPISVRSEDVRVQDGNGNFLYNEKAPKSYIKCSPSEPLLYAKGHNGHFFGEDICAELRSTGRYHLPVDPKTLEPFSDHTDRAGNVYTVDENGDLTMDGRVVCAADRAVIVSVSDYDPNLVIGLGVKEVTQYLSKLPVYESEGERYVCSKEEALVLAQGGDVNIRIGDRQESVHYDVQAGQIVAAESYESIRLREGVERNNKLLSESKSLSEGLGESEGAKMGM